MDIEGLTLAGMGFLVVYGLVAGLRLRSRSSHVMRPEELAAHQRWRR